MLSVNLEKPQTENQNSDPLVWDVAILGAGPSGLTAAIYASRSLLKTLVLEKMGSGGQAAITAHIENYPGFPDGVNGFDLSQKMEEQAKNFGARFEYAVVEGFDKGPDGIFTVKTDGKPFRARSLIISTGASSKKLGVKGEEQYIGRGISFCATCDASFYKGKTVAVIGGGDSALDEALYLTKFAEKVYIVHRRDELRAEKILQKRARENPKIELILESVVDEVLGETKIQRLRIRNVKTGGMSEIPVDGMFEYIGLAPNTDNIPVDKDASGYVITNNKMETSVAGVLACGDCRNTALRQVATAVGDGAVAAFYAGKYLENLEHA